MFVFQRKIPNKNTVKSCSYILPQLILEETMRKQENAEKKRVKKREEHTNNY
jgi:hypothetical protein